MQEKNVLFYTARCKSDCFNVEILICGDYAVAAPFKMPSNTNRQREAQFSPGSGVFFPADHTGMEGVEFCFAHGAFQADQEPVVKVGHVIDAVFINHEGAEQPAKLKELHEIG